MCDVECGDENDVCDVGVWVCGVKDGDWGKDV